MWAVLKSQLRSSAYLTYLSPGYWNQHFTKSVSKPTKDQPNKTPWGRKAAKRFWCDRNNSPFMLLAFPGGAVSPCFTLLWDFGSIPTVLLHCFPPKLILYLIYSAKWHCELLVSPEVLANGLLPLSLQTQRYSELLDTQRYLWMLLDQFLFY